MKYSLLNKQADDEFYSQNMKLLELQMNKKSRACFSVFQSDVHYFYSFILFIYFIVRLLGVSQTLLNLQAIYIIRMMCVDRRSGKIPLIISVLFPYLRGFNRI